jgi:hypothetical protein
MTDTIESAEPLRAACQQALAEERLLWRRVAAPALLPDERVQAYGRWRAAADRVKALSLQLQQVRAAAGGQPPGGPAE